MCSRYLIVTDGRQTDRQTDRRLTVASPRSALASRGKKYEKLAVLTIIYSSKGPGECTKYAFRDPKVNNKFCRPPPYRPLTKWERDNPSSYPRLPYSRRVHNSQSQVTEDLMSLATFKIVNHFHVSFLPRDASAERGNATVSCLSVRLSVCLSVTFRYQQHIGWNSSKITSWPNSLRPLLWLTPNMGDLVQREHPQN